jgi:hypothetical protein
VFNDGEQGVQNHDPSDTGPALKLMGMEPFSLDGYRFAQADEKEFCTLRRWPNQLPRGM